MSNQSNEDNRDLQPLYGGNLTIGFVDEVNGSGAREVPEFTPTKAELLELVKHWELTFLDTNYFVFWSQQIGSTERRLSAYAERRICRIVDLLGDDAVEAFREVRKTFAARIGSQDWEDFCAYVGINPTDGQ